MEASVLITKVEKYLKKIQEDTISLDNIENLENFYKLHTKLDNRIAILQEFKDKMDAQGYTAPFRSLNRVGTSTVGEQSNEEKMDNSRYNKTFRTKANVKKNILDRVKSAINSHKIAIGNLEQFGYVKCSSCYKKYRINELKDIHETCSCGSKEFNFKINNDLSHRIEIIPYLPLSGNYMVLRGSLSDWGKDSFNKIIAFLKQESERIVTSLSLKIRYKDEKKRWIHKNITLNSEFKDNYEEEIRRRYGKYVRIEQLSYYKTRPSIIDDHHTRIALALAYVNYSQNIIDNIKEDVIKKNVSDYQRLLKYDKIKYKYTHMTPKFIDETDYEGIEAWRKTKINELYEKEGYFDKHGKLNRSLNRDLIKKDNIKKNIFANIAPTLIMWDIFKYYMTSSKNRRIKTVSPFPYSSIQLDRPQRKVFETSYNKAIQCLINETDIKIIKIPQKDLILHEKFKLEYENKNANISFYYPALAAVLINNVNNDLDIKLIGNVLNVNDSKIKKEQENINILKGNDEENKEEKNNALADQFRKLVLKK